MPRYLGDVKVESMHEIKFSCYFCAMRKKNVVLQQVPVQDYAAVFLSSLFTAIMRPVRLTS